MMEWEKIPKFLNKIPNCNSIWSQINHEVDKLENNPNPL